MECRAGVGATGPRLRTGGVTAQARTGYGWNRNMAAQ